VIFALAERPEKRVRLVRPDRAERSVSDVPGRVSLPELRKVNVTDGVHVGDALAGRVAAVAFEVPVDSLCAIGPHLAVGVLDEVARVGVVADEQRLDLLARLVVRAGEVTGR